MHIRHISQNELTPKGVLSMYRNLLPVVSRENSSGSKSSSGEQNIEFMFVEVQLRTYLMARFHQKTANPAKYKQFMKDHQAYFSALSKWNRKQQFWASADCVRRIRNCFWGKGLPVDYEMALEGAVFAGECAPNQKAMQAYCDRHLGIDCSGFVRAYFVLKGKLTPASVVGSTGFWRMNKTLRNSAEEIKSGDCLNWCNSKGSVTATSGSTTGHIALADSVAVERNGVHRFVVCESAGGVGPTSSTYEIIKVLETKAGSVFRVKRGLNGQTSHVRIYSINF